MINKRRIFLSLVFITIVAAMLGASLAKQDQTESKARPFNAGKPTEIVMKRGGSTQIDLRRLPRIRPTKRERPEREEPEIERTEISRGNIQPEAAGPAIAPQSGPAPAPLSSFDGLDFANWGAGHPPDPNGDVGPTYYIQTINTSIGVFRKSDGVRVAAFTFNTLMSQGFGDVRGTGNFGDPVVLYDTFEDRWIISDFAFTLDGSGNVNPPISYQVFAVSKTGDPVSGGWNFYSVNTAGGFGDYPKLAIWPDGLYMSVNMFGYAAGSSFQNPRAYAFNKAQMYAGAPNVQVVSFDAPSADFTILPSNARLQAGTPPPGTPNYFVSTWEFLNALTVYKFHVDWNHIGLSTFTGPDAPLAATSWPNASVPNAPSQGGNNLDVLQIRAMVQNQYSNLGGAESLWITHTVRRQNTTGFAAPRWYQVNVTGGTVAPNLPQSATWDPDGANVIYRFMPSIAVDRVGDMAMGYTTSNSTTKPALKYAGRLAADPVNTFSQTETLLNQGTGTQTGTCGGSSCIRWGDYSSMTLDPDGCTFWYTNEYYSADGLSFLTRIGSFAFPSCTPVGAGGAVSGTVTAAVGGAPISGATVALGSRTATTDPSGFYSFPNIPAGVYPVIMASNPGFTSSSFTSVVVNDGITTTQDFSLGASAPSACLTDTSQSDFEAGVGTSVDLVTSPGDVTLLGGGHIDQQNTTLGTSGVGVTTTTWGGQTFTPTVTGKADRIDVNLFCSGCTGTTPNLTMSIRATSGGLPTGADLASSTITGFNSGSAVFYTATFGTPPTLTAGTQYAMVVRPTANPSPGTYALTRSGTATAGSDVYAGGTRVAGATSGTVWSIPLTGGVSTDAGFKVFMDSGFALSGNFVSGTKDSNPAAGETTTWTTLSWTASTPANTTLSFQVAGSNSNTGPFVFVGPDGTGATFFTTSGASLAQFTGDRYLQYKAYLTTTDSTMTPTINDVTVCYSNVDCTGTTATITPTPAQVCPNSTGNTASGPAGGSNYSWSTTNGVITGGANTQTVTYTAGASGNVTLMLSMTAANGCPVSNSVDVPIVAAPTTPTISGAINGTGTNNEACPAEPLTLAANSTGAATYQWYSGGNQINGQTSATLTITAAGSYTVTATNGCATTSQSAPYVVQDPTPATPTISVGGPTTFCSGSSVLLTSSSASGNQWFFNGNQIVGATGQQYTATATGSYTVQATAGGCSSSVSSPVSVVVNPAVSITTSTIPQGTAGALYPSTSIGHSGGTGTITFSEAGTLPTGMTFSSGGVLSGTPLKTGSFPITITATDQSSCSGMNSYTLVINCPVIAVGPGSAISVMEFAAAQPVQFTQTGGIGAVTFSTSSTLPTGMTLSPAGVLSGTPTQGGTFSVTVTATDSNMCKGSVTVTLTVLILDKCLKDDHAGYYVQFSSTTGDYVFTVCGASGFKMAGKGTLKLVNSQITITDSKPDRNVTIQYSTSALTGRATLVKILGPGVSQTYSISDTNPHPVCSCGS